MARDLVFWCDICLADEDERTPGGEVVIQLGNLKPRLLALCDRHMDEIYNPLRELLQDMPIADSVPPNSAGFMPTKRQGENAGDFTCLVPDCGRPYKYKGSLRTHLNEVHNMTLQEMVKQYGADAPEEATLAFSVGEDEKPPKVTRAECDKCDTVYEWPEHKRPAQALGVHKATVHKIKGERHDQRKGSKPSAKAALSA